MITFHDLIILISYRKRGYVYVHVLTLLKFRTFKLPLDLTESAIASIITNRIHYKHFGMDKVSYLMSNTYNPLKKGPRGGPVAMALTLCLRFRFDENIVQLNIHASKMSSPAVDTARVMTKIILQNVGQLHQRSQLRSHDGTFWLQMILSQGTHAPYSKSLPFTLQ